MKNYYRCVLVIHIMFLSFITFGCSGAQIQKPPESFETTCIQGTVWYRAPTDSTPMRYPYATVTAWRHGIDQGLAEVKADEAGNFCIEVPLGDLTVDLKVWGVRRLGGRSYTCKGSEENIDLGTTSKKCGEDCTSIDIITECGEFQPPYHRQM